MSSNIETDVPTNKAKQTMAMVYRSQQGLLKKLRNIDVEYSKALSGIDRDLEKTRASLKAFRVNQLRLRSNSLDSPVTVQKQDYGHGSTLYLPSPLTRRGSQTHILASENNGSFKIFEKHRLSEMSARPEETVRRNTGTKQRDMKKKDMKQDKLSGQKMAVVMKEKIVAHDLAQKEFDLEIKDLEEGESQESSEITESNTVPCCLPEYNGPEVEDGLETGVAMARGDLVKKVTMANEKTVGKIQGGLGASESQPSRPSSSGNEDGNDSDAADDESSREMLRNSWTSEESNLHETVDQNPLFFPAKTNLAREESFFQPAFRKRFRRSSLPNIISSRPATDFPVSMKTKIRRIPSLESIQEKYQTTTPTESLLPSKRLALRPRRTSVATMTAVSLPLPEWNKSFLRGSSQDQRMPESLRKIGRRLSGEYPGKRLLAQRGVRTSTALRTTESKIPPSSCAPSNISDLEECRYIRR